MTSFPGARRVLPVLSVALAVMAGGWSAGAGSRPAVTGTSGPVAAAPGSVRPDPRGPLRLKVLPSREVVSPEETATLEARVGFAGGFGADRIHLWATGLPTGLRATFTPDPLPHEGVSLVTVSGTAPVGTYRFSVGAEAGGAVARATGTLVVSRSPRFTMAVSPAAREVSAGREAVFRVTLRPANGFRAPVRLGVEGIPGGERVSPALAPERTTTVRVPVAADTPPGRYPLTVTARGGGRVDRTTVPVVVRGAGIAAWGVRDLGSTGAGNNSVRFGDGRNDGVNRLYVGTIQSGRVMEFSWNGSSWGNPQPISSSGAEIHNLTIGPGRNDGRNRIYACRITGPLLELTRTGSGWSERVVANREGSCTHAVVGIGRNDGRQRVYATQGNAVWEYTKRRSGGWREVRVGTVPEGETHGIDIGRGRGGGRRHLYIASDRAGTWEATFSNGRWRMRPMGDDGDVRNVSVGPGRDDGRNRVYAATRSGRVREFTWSGGRWRIRNTGSVGTILVHAYVIDGRNDGRQRVYASGGNGNLYEFTWTGSRWRRRTIVGGSDYLYGFHFGRRPGSSLVRLYAGSFNDHVYEYTWT